MLDLRGLIWYGNNICRILQLKGASKMLNDEICKVRDKLNKAIEDNEDYEKILKISTDLDELIASFYKKDVS